MVTRIGNGSISDAHTGCMPEIKPPNGKPPERFRRHGYTAVPVLNENEQYVGSVTEGDFLRHLLSSGSLDPKLQERCRIGVIVRKDFCPALPIDVGYSEMIAAVLNQNYVPIVDGRNTLCGILTRRGVICYLDELVNAGKSRKE
ncbi:MAG: CBS domain-containing protein [Eubacteriales bacterium]|nr:CBS domain-containing protein [Eubacteriales bacterium]